MLRLKKFRRPLPPVGKLDSREVLTITSRAMANQPRQFAVPVMQNHRRIRLERTFGLHTRASTGDIFEIHYLSVHGSTMTLKAYEGRAK